MKELVIDTNVYSFLCRGHQGVLRVLSEYDTVIVPATVLGELEAGFRNGTRYAANKTWLARFLAIRNVRVADVTAAVSESYGLIYSSLKAKGAMIPINDVWIAATAQTADAPILTFDGHFDKVDGVEVIRLSVEGSDRPKTIFLKQRKNT